MKTLFKIHITQIRRSKNKMAIFGKIYLYVVWWITSSAMLATAITPEIKGIIARIAPLIAILLPIGIIIPDIIQKLIFKHDDTAMDAFLKSRPIKQQTWNNFQRLAQLWHADNLFLPGVLIAPLFVILPIGWALLCIVLTYIVSVIDGAIVMEIKRGNGYAEEGAITRNHKAIGAKTIYNSIFDIQIKSILRSRRLLTSTIMFPIIMMFYCPIFLLDDMPAYFPIAFFPLILTFPSMNIGQYGMGIEARCFSGIWTRPVSLYRILMDKYKFYGLLTCVFMIFLTPMWLIVGLPIHRLIAASIYVAGTGNLIILMEAFKCSPFDLFGKVFFNQQGTKAAYKASVFAAMFSAPILTVGLYHFTGDYVGHGILAALGIAGFVTCKPYFRWVEKRFMNNRYKYMEKYTD